MRRVAWLVVAVLLLGALIPAAAQAAGEIRVVVDGQTVRFDEAPYEDWGNGGRLVVQVRPVAMALGCARISFDPLDGTVQVSQSCLSGTETYLRMWPRDESRTVEVGQRWGAKERYQIDSAPHFQGGSTMAPARLLADAFNCYSWWTDSDRTFHIDCDRVSQAHQDVAAVMARYPAKLTEDGLYDYTGYPDGAPMYPTTLREVRRVLAPVNVALSKFREHPESVAVSVRSDRDLVQLLNPNDRTQVWMNIYPDLSYAMLDEIELSNLQQRLTETRTWQARFASATGALIGAVIPEAEGVKAMAAAAGGLGGWEWGYSISDEDISRMDRCLSQAKLILKRAGESEDWVRVTVGTDRKGHITCVPFEYNARTWEAFTAKEVGR